VKPPIHLIFIFVVPFYNFANNVDLGFSCSKFDCVSTYVDGDFSCYLFFKQVYQSCWF
jgi:hypothetical protein